MPPRNRQDCHRLRWWCPWASVLGLLVVLAVMATEVVATAGAAVLEEPMMAIVVTEGEE